jgi:hypothetical protein
MAENLTGRYPSSLAPTSQEGGNLTHPDRVRADAMTAPGSQPVTPQPADDESSVMPQPQLGDVYRPPNRVSGGGREGEGGTWTSVSGARWGQ